MMDLQKIFTQFIEHSSSENQLEQIQKQLLLDYRQINPSNEDITLLAKLCVDKQNALFVVELVSVMPTLPQTLLTSLVQLALTLQDNDLDSKIMEANVRIFGFQAVDKLLFELFENGDDVQKNSIISILYHVIDQPYIWEENGSYYEVDFDAMDDYQENEINELFLQAILQTYFDTHQVALKSKICLMFQEQTIHDFPKQLQALAQQVITSCK